MAYINGNYALLPVEEIAEYGATVEGVTPLVVDMPYSGRNIKVKVTGDIPQVMTRGEFVGTVAEIWNESITEHNWVNESKLGSFTVYNNCVPVDNRTDLYVNIPAFYGASAGLLVTDGIIYRTFYACDYNGGEVYCRIDNGEIYISYDGQTIINYGIEENAKIIGVSCNGENFTNNALDIYGCSFGLGVTVTRSGKNLIPYPYSDTTKGANGITFTPHTDGSVTISGQNNGNGNSVFYLVSNGSVVLPKGDYIVSGLTSGCIIMGASPTAGYVAFADKRTLAEDVEFKNFYLQVAKGNTTVFDNVVVKPMIEMGTIATEYAPYVEPTEHTPNTDGTIDGVTSVSPVTILTADTDGVTIQATPVNKRYFKIKKMR